MRSTHPPIPGFSPELLFAGYGLELAGGYWFAPGSDASAPWYVSVGFTVALGLWPAAIVLVVADIASQLAPPHQGGPVVALLVESVDR